MLYMTNDSYNNFFQLLFRNMNNSASTTTATLLLGRRKRSIDKFDDDATIILKNLYNFSSKL